WVKLGVISREPLMKLIGTFKMSCTTPGSWLYASSMKNELSWIPLARGSEAIEGATSGTGLATTRRRLMATKTRGFDFAQRAENCGCFMPGEVIRPIFPQESHKVARY